MFESIECIPPFSIHHAVKTYGSLFLLHTCCFNSAILLRHTEQIESLRYGTRNLKISIAHRQAGGDFLRINIEQAKPADSYFNHR